MLQSQLVRLEPRSLVPPSSGLVLCYWDNPYAPKCYILQVNLLNFFISRLKGNGNTTKGGQIYIGFITYIYKWMKNTAPASYNYKIGL